MRVTKRKVKKTRANPRGITYGYRFQVRGKEYTDGGFLTKRAAHQAMVQGHTRAKGVTGNLTFWELALEWFKFLEENRTDAHYKQQMSRLYHHGSKLHDMPWYEVTKTVFKQSQHPGISDKTFNVNANAAVSMFNHAVREELIDYNPLTGIGRKEVPIIHKAVPTAAHIEDLRALFDEQDPYLLWLDTSIDVAGRPGEILAVPWEKAELEEDPLLILTTRKTRKASFKERRLPIHEELATRLKRWRMRNRNERIFPWPYSTMHRKLKQWCNTAEIPNFAPHALRHFAASQMELAGCPKEEIQRRLGHDQITTTELYLKSVTPQRSALQYTYERKPVGNRNQISEGGGS
jgi:integrase